jgi:cytochrome c oxidase subunit III
MSHPHEPGSYYVPEYSWWPILAAVGLFLLGLGSIEYFGSGTLGPKLLVSGAGVLLLVTIGWLSAVIQESRECLYDAQMHRTFRWGMIWFIFSDIMLFIGLLGALWYYRLFTFPQLAGSPHAFELLTHYLLWPDFQSEWPLLANPDPAQFIAPEQGLVFGWQSIMTTLVMLGSGVTLVFANLGFKTQRKALLNTGLIATLLLIALFFVLKIDAVGLAMHHFGMTLGSGIYGSIVMFLFIIFLLHSLIAVLLLGVIVIRALSGHFSIQNDFSIRAFSWFWCFMIVTWLVIFFSVY